MPSRSRPVDAARKDRADRLDLGLSAPFLRRHPLSAARCPAGHRTRAGAPVERRGAGRKPGAGVLGRRSGYGGAHPRRRALRAQGLARPAHHRARHGALHAALAGDRRCQGGVDYTLWQALFANRRVSRGNDALLAGAALARLGRHARHLDGLSQADGTAPDARGADRLDAAGLRRVAGSTCCGDRGERDQARARRSVAAPPARVPAPWR